MPPTSRKARLDVATKHLEAPLAVADLAAFDQNAADLVRRAADKPIRVASKSVRCRYLVERALARPGFAGVMTYSLPEALWLTEQWQGTEFDGTDLLVAYPTVDHAALRRLAADDRARSSIAVVVDSVAHLDLIDAALGADHPDVRVCLELDVSWRPLPGVHVGTRRSPVYQPAEAGELAERIVRRPGFTLVGLMAYEGQIAGVGDTGGRRMHSAAVKLMQRRSGPELVARRAAAVAAVRAVADLEYVNGGGTGSIELTRSDDSVTEIAAGSGLIGPTLFDAYSRFSPEPAVLYALPVVRRPADGIATLFSGGYIASGPAQANRQPLPYLPEGLSLVPMEGAGEVQTPVTGDAANELALGDRVWLRHAKAGELAERFDEYHVIEGDQVVRTVPTYRGEGRNFG